jgi:CheY-like chemotaxis protein
LVELHEGAITAHSEGRGKGSSFTVRLPIAQGISNAELSAPITPSRAAKSGLQILVVDDNKDSADTLCLLLKIKKHEVRTARDGFEAIEMASTFQPDMILMDVSMPNLNGYDAARRIRQTPQGRDIFIVALTGCSQPEDVARSREAGCSAHLVKPVNFAALEELMKRRISTQH